MTQAHSETGGTLIARTVVGKVITPPVEGARVRFGRSPQPEVEVPIGEDDREVSRQHGLLVHRQGWWWLSNLGRLALEVSGTHRLNSADDPLPLGPGYTSVLISSRTRKHLLELHVVEASGWRPPPVFDLRTQVPRTWPLSDDERLVLVALGQRYLLQEDNPQPLAYQHVANLLNELKPGSDWNERKVEARVSNVRARLIASGVANLTRREVGEPVGNLLNQNLLTELVVTSGTLTVGDLALIED